MANLGEGVGIRTPFFLVENIKPRVVSLMLCVCGKCPYISRKVCTHPAPREGGGHFGTYWTPIFNCPGCWIRDNLYFIINQVLKNWKSLYHVGCKS